MRYDLLNKGVSNVSFRLKGFLRKTVLREGQRLTIDIKNEDLKYYQGLRPLGVVIVPTLEKQVSDTEITTKVGTEVSDTDIPILDTQEVKTNDIAEVSETEVIVQNEVAGETSSEQTTEDDTDLNTDETGSYTDSLLEDDEELSGESSYTFKFLTRDRAITVLKNRGVEFSQKDSATELKKLVLKTNPR